MKKIKNGKGVFKLEITDESHLEDEGSGMVLELEKAEERAIKNKRIVAYK